MDRKTPKGNGAAQKQYGLSASPGGLPGTGTGVPLPAASPGQRVWAVTMPDTPQLLASASEAKVGTVKGWVQILTEDLQGPVCT